MIGLADKSYVVASDASAIIEHTTLAITLDNYQVAKLCAGHGCLSYLIGVDDNPSPACRR